MKLLNEFFVLETPETPAEIQDECVYHIRLNAEHFIYKAHFPGFPVTPGVCIVQMVCELLGLRLGREVEVGQISNLKFLAVIIPTETEVIDVHFTSIECDEAGCKVKVQLSDLTHTYSKLNGYFKYVTNA